MATGRALGPRIHAGARTSARAHGLTQRGRPRNEVVQQHLDAWPIQVALHVSGVGPKLRERSQLTREKSWRAEEAEEPGCRGGSCLTHVRQRRCETTHYDHTQCLMEEKATQLEAH